MRRTSQNGWPVLDSNSPLLYTWVIPACTGLIRVRLRNGSAGFLLAHFLLWYAERVEPLRGPIVDDWGYALRPIRGKSSGYSNHAAGCAVDANATRHPLGKRGTLLFKTRGVVALVRIRARLLVYRGVIRSGAFYSGRPDEMHYEINRPLPVAEAVARRLMRTPRGARILAANTTQRRVIES